MIVLSLELSLLTTRNSMSPLRSSRTALAAQIPQVNKQSSSQIKKAPPKYSRQINVHSLGRAFGFFDSSGDSEAFILFGERSLVSSDLRFISVVEIGQFLFYIYIY